jgi:hypothetical protein
MPMLLYEAGHETHLNHTITLNHVRAGFDPAIALTLTRFVEFWCQKNCKGKWRVEESDTTLSVSFSHPRDRVLFQISEEFVYFEGRCV